MFYVIDKPLFLMKDKQYEKSRPSIPAHIRRSIEVESGHSCAIKNCNEHTYLEIHHIDENRENNSIDNLILLCDKHHKMSHNGIIDRKSLKEYKKLLTESLNSKIFEKFNDLEELIKNQNNNYPNSELSTKQPLKSDISKSLPRRFEVLNFSLCQITISKFETEINLLFERCVEFNKDDEVLILDAIRQDDDLESDIIIEFQYLRKRYLDSYIYANRLDKKIELYQLLTGRNAIGILIIVINFDINDIENKIPQTLLGVQNSENEISLKIYTCEEAGFYPGAISAGILASNIKS